MKGLRNIEIDEDCGHAWLAGGATWQQVCNATIAQERLPVGLTMIVDTTVAGTLSVGGVGSESFRTGLQVDRVFELEVATLDGRVVRCSRENNRELFDAVRAGLGQCGVIVKARYPLRRAKARVRTYGLVYTSGRELVADLHALIEEPRCDFMFAAMLCTEQSSLQLVLFLGNEFDDEVERDESALLSGLHFKRELTRTEHVQWRADGNPGHPFFRRFEKPKADAPRRPWVDHVCEPRAGAELLSEVTAEPTIAARPGICGSIQGVAADADRAPLIAPGVPGPLLVMGLYPEPSDQQQLQAALVRLRRHNQHGLALGAKRYLSGFLEDWTAQDWSKQFGEAWPWLCSMKQRFDPDELLNNQSICWR